MLTRRAGGTTCRVYCRRHCSCSTWLTPAFVHPLPRLTRPSATVRLSIFAHFHSRIAACRTSSRQYSCLTHKHSSFCTSVASIIPRLAVYHAARAQGVSSVHVCYGDVGCRWTMHSPDTTAYLRTRVTGWELENGVRLGALANGVGKSLCARSSTTRCLKEA